MHDHDDLVTRRDFLGAGAAATAAAGILPRLAHTPASSADRMIGVPFEARATVRIGMIGVGGRGESLLHDILAVEGAVVTALCD